MDHRLALFGGSFDPVHNGHLHLARAVCERLQFDTIRFLPALCPPHKRGRPRLPIADRLHLLELAVAGDPRFLIDDYEVRRGTACYTYETLCHFRNVLPPATHLHFLIGGDSLRELPDWFRAADLVREFELITVPRDPNIPADELLAPVKRAFEPAAVERLRRNILRVAPLPISSTAIRARIRAGQAIDHLVPPAVARVIAERGLYTGR